jgi:hypothetical protein
MGGISYSRNSLGVLSWSFGGRGNPMKHLKIWLVGFIIILSVVAFFGVLLGPYVYFLETGNVNWAFGYAIFLFVGFVSYGFGLMYYERSEP